MEKTLVSGALLFIAVGWSVGPMGLDVFSFAIDNEGLRLLAELTLAVVLFTDAAHSRLNILKKSHTLPERLLLLGLPFTFLLGWGVALLLFPDFTLIEAAILATILAPTDAALGKAVVSSEDVPAPLAEALNVESGLNDGICVPLLAVLLSFGMTMDGEPMVNVWLTILQKVGIGLLVGGIVAYLGEKWVLFCTKRKWTHSHTSSIAVPSLAFGSFTLAEACGGSGFIACFVGGLIFGALYKEEKHHHFLKSEAAGDALSLVTWVIFGAVIVGQCVGNLTWSIALYAVLSLTLIRMIPVVLSLTGSGLPFREKVFIGWFGPRGLASIVFIMMVLHADLEKAPKMASIVMTTIILSILFHGISANPLVKRLKRSPRSPSVEL